MFVPLRAIATLAVLAIPIAAAIGTARAQAPSTPLRVVMVDNAAPSNPPGDPERGYYAYAPEHFAVVKGQQVVFDNPATSRWGHSVTSVSWSGALPYDSLETGRVFDSSPTLDEEIEPGNSWTLDTGSLDPGQYMFYCNIHPWMVGTFTVQSPS